MTTVAHFVGRLRFRHLALLVALDDHRNLRRAAAAVHLAQPSATKLVRDLEQVFGFPIFDRLPRGMEPTEVGREVLVFARRMLTDLERFTLDLDSKRKGGYGQLIIGAIMGAAPDVVAYAMADIKRCRPLLAVKLLGETSDEILALLIQRRIDLAVGRFSNPLQHNAIAYEYLCDEPLCMVARKEHSFARKRSLGLVDLQAEAWILPPLTSPGRQMIEQEFGESGMKTPANLVECTSIFAALQLLQKSDAVTLLPESAVRDHLRAGLLVRLALDVGISWPGFGILTRRGESMGLAATEFTQLLRKYGTMMSRSELAIIKPVRQRRR